MLLIGNNLELLPTLEDNSIDCVLTDPPYGISRKTNLKTLNRFGMEFGEWDTFSTEWLASVKPKLKEGANVLVFTAWQKLTVLNDAMEANGLIVKKLLHWVRKNPFPLNRDRVTTNTCDYCIHAVNGKNWTFNRRADKPYETGLFYHPCQKKNGHSTPKPIKLLEEMLQIYTNKEDIVLDPFAGSCTLIEACSKQERNYICIERQREFVPDKYK